MVAVCRDHLHSPSYYIIVEFKYNVWLMDA